MATGHGERLSRQKERAIAALLAKPTVEAAARQVGVSARTLQRWLQLPEFQSAYRRARREIVEHAIGRLQKAMRLAVSTLVKNLACANPAARNKAAELILSHALEGVELTDLAERVEVLEQAQRGLQTSRNGAYRP